MFQGFIFSLGMMEYAENSSIANLLIEEYLSEKLILENYN